MMNRPLGTRLSIHLVVAFWTSALNLSGSVGKFVSCFIITSDTVLLVLWILKLTLFTLSCVLPGTPINRLPIMAKSVLDLYELYNLVIARGGLVDVINKKLWQEIIKGLHLPSSITSAAFTLRTQ